ncbi:hypothetical protein [Mesorhizobium sp. KR1-2]|uniref:hypothetical protein n=1 Tax=Mesorhizobium sp. KR1-2 TaxID=3156609 RepID=UPI0032B43183
MTGRLLSPPQGLGVVAIEPLSGPRAVSAGASQSVENFVQSFASPFGLWRLQFSFAPMSGAMFRRYRGWVTGMHGGANATRWTFFDPDMMPVAEAGGLASVDQQRAGMPWANGKPWNIAGADPWFNTGNWAVTPPLETVAASAGRDDTIVRLRNGFWGQKLDVGDYVGFAPNHFGMYTITEVFEPGTYRIWPRLRRSIVKGDFATLMPIMALRPENESAAAAARGLEVADGLAVIFVEVPDYDLRDYFTD